MTKHKILVIGAGKIGLAVSVLLARTNEYEAFLGDIHKPSHVPKIDDNPIHFVTADITNPSAIEELIKAKCIQGIVSCLPFNLTIEVAKIAASCGIDYFDPTEDVATSNAVNELAKTSASSFAPQCGLAPGFISIAANSLTRGFKEIDHIKMRVGALTQSTSNSLNYSFTWSVDGVINEYINPCVVIEDGEKKFKPALGDLEAMVVDNGYYEAFHTSGGVGSLVDTYFGRVKNLDYKTMRYKGHRDKILFMLNDLRLREDPQLVKQILTKVIPHAADDKVVIHVSVQGDKDGVFSESTYTNTLYPVDLDGVVYTAIQMTTATSICAVVDLVMHEKRFQGLVKQEQISLEDFLANRFGAYYLASSNFGRSLGKDTCCYA